MINITNIDNDIFLDSLPNEISNNHKKIIKKYISGDLNLIEKKAKLLLKECNNNFPFKGIEDKQNNITLIWNCIKQEVYYLMCTENKKYDDIRNSEDIKEYIKTAIIYISGVILATLNITATVIAGAISLAIYLVLKIGKNIWCSLNSTLALVIE